ncbi:hypothetical protein WQ53_09505 [Pseudoxanthomonas suwonensis]|uniref:prolyl oligopeptidase n=2 Tax=Pseudoxanthomonas suwonensis TaxID=314722 RepID=A0A0E3Z1V2_9GAMM|nr:hypothetical protein WQ53_09505 [Pseudoxanthomonas suwonensis]
MPGCARAWATDAPPPAKKIPVVDTYHGVEIVDPYRWLEDLRDPDTRDWIKAQAEYTDRVLQALPERDAILARLQAPDAPETVIRRVQRRGERWFYLRRAPDENDFVLVMRERAGPPERVLVDPATAFADGRRWSINHFDASPDGRHVAYLVSEGGREDPDTRVFDVQAGRDTGLRIERTWDARWLPDGSGFFSMRLPRLSESDSALDGRRNLRTYLHRLGAPDPERDRLLAGAGIDPRLPMDPIESATLTVPEGTELLLARIDRGVDRHSAFYVAPLASLEEDAGIPWRRLADFQDEVADIAIHGQDLYLLSSRDAPRYRVLRTSLQAPDPARAQVVVAEGRGAIQAIAAARDALYVQTLDGGLSQLSRVEYGRGTPQPVALPEGTSAALLPRATAADAAGAVYALAAFTTPPAYLHYDPAVGRSTDLHLLPPPTADRSRIQTRVLQAPSHDGVDVPMVVMHRKGIALDGSHPALLIGYGAYGISILDPANWPERSVIDRWVDNGFVLAIAGVRGGGEYGRPWHLAGKEATKPNTWKDFIAAAETLVREGYTRPERLAGNGASAGGILIGNAFVERPDLFAVALVDVGWTNALRLEASTNGAGNAPEFGTTASRLGFEALRAMDAFHKVKDGDRYPAVLLVHGYNDPRVDVWFSAKFAARLQAASGSGKPVLLRVDYDAGHGHGTGRAQNDAQDADKIAFIRWRLGLSGDAAARASGAAGE